MKKLILSCFLATGLFANDMLCDMYFDKVSDSITLMSLSIGDRRMSDFLSGYDDFLYYANHAMVNCDRESDQKLLLSSKEQIKKVFLEHTNGEK